MKKNDKILDILSPILSNALKDNTSLKMAVLTGVLRVGGASLFSSFNNLDVYDVMSSHYNEYFGFTENETKELLGYYGLELNLNVKNYKEIVLYLIMIKVLLMKVLKVQKI